VEAFYDGGLAVAIFSMPVLLAFTMGFILKAVGPGLVVPAMFQLQKTGLGRDQGIPSTVVIAASFDDIVAITGYSIFSSIAITGQSNVAWQIASGPLQVGRSRLASRLLMALPAVANASGTHAQHHIIPPFPHPIPGGVWHPGWPHWWRAAGLHPPFLLAAQAPGGAVRRRPPAHVLP
jgi:hypothetical protein